MAGDVITVVPGMYVYIHCDKHVWIQARVTHLVNKHTCGVVLSDQVKKECLVKDVLPCTDQVMTEVQSLTQLSPINQASVLRCLHERYSEGIYYTNAGSTIVAVNPFCNVEHLYTVDTAFTYHLEEQECPHIYMIGSKAYREMCRGLGHVNQCIIVSGESGSGKTVSAKHLLRYMTLVSNSSSDGVSTRASVVCQSVERRILDSNPILEAFGNAVTQRNDNSSRFGKFIQLQFSRSGQMMGAEINTYLLEKTRVVHQSPGEANFHIFYQIVSSLREAKDTRLGQLVFEMGEDGFDILPRGKPITDNRDLTHTLEAMTEIGLSHDTQNHIVKILVAILFLCNVQFTQIEEELSQLLQDKGDQFLDTTFFELEVSQTSLQQCSDLLGLESAHIEQVLLYRSIQSGGNKRRSVFVKPVPQHEAYSRRDCLATLLYARLFDWLVTFINEQIKTDDFNNTIGLLDIYGFEAFESNSLEQLCINYANEKLQQHYVQHFLKDLQREYESECINWQFLSYSDNQPCLDVLEGQGSVFGMLNEDVQLNRKSDPRQLCERVLQLSQNAPAYVKRPRTFMKTPGFTIHHYAGDVTYNGEALSTKNKDIIPQELIVMLQNSSNVFVSELFTGYHGDETTGRRRKTVLGKFKASLDILMSSLHTSDVHYIRCIKPNTRGQPSLFDRHFVMSQLSANGIIESVKISCHGYPVRMAYTSFLQRYGLIIRNTTAPPPSDRDGCDPGDGDSLYDPLDALYRRQLNMMSDSPHRVHHTPRKRLRRRAGLSSVDHTRRCTAAVMKIQFTDCHALTHQFGKTKLFLHQHQVDQLETARLQILCRKAAMIQRAWRRYKHRCDARIKLQYNMAANTIQVTWRKHRQRTRRNAVLLIQKSFRMHTARLKFKTMLDKVKQDKKLKKKKRSWKPIMDRNHTSRSSSRSSSQGQISDTSDSSSVMEMSGDNSLKDSLSRGTECDTKIKFMTSTPTCDKVRSAKRCGNTDNGPKSEENSGLTPTRKRSVKKGSKMIKGRPNFTDRSTVTRAGSLRGKKPFTALENNVSCSHDDTDAPPIKKQRTVDGCITTLADLVVGDGIVTRRRLPKVPIRFHTRPSVLKNAHIVHQRELTCGLQDCLPDNQSKCGKQNTNQLD